MLNDLFIGGGDGSAHPVGCIHIGAEFVRIAVLAVLCLSSDSFPHIPRLALAVFNAGQVGRMGLIAVAGGVGAAAVGDEHQIVLDEVDGLLRTVLDINDLLGNPPVALGFDDDILHIHAVLDAHTVRFKILDERQDHALVLIVFGEAKGAEIGQAVDMVNIAAEIALHFKRTGPALEGKHGLPVKPEVRAPEGIGQHIGYLLVLQILFRRQEQLRKRHCGILIQPELLVGMGILAAVHARTAQGIVRIVLIQPIVFVQNRNTRGFDRRHIAEGVPHDLKMIVHFASAAHEEALGDILPAVAAAARKLQLFEQMDMLALHLPVADKVKGCRQPGKTGADDVCRFFIHILRLFGAGKRFISSCRVIHNENLLCFLLCAFIIPGSPPKTINRKSPVIRLLSRGTKLYEILSEPQK